MLPILQIGPLAIQLPGLLLLLSVWFGVTLAERSAPRHGLPAPEISNLILISLVAGLIGARLGYAVRYADVYLAAPLSLLALTPVTLAPLDGMAVGLVAALIYGQRHDLGLWATLDSLAPGTAAVAIGLGLAHLAGGDAFGAPTSLPWAVDMWGALRHPSQVYEVLAGSAILGLSMRLDRSEAPEGLSFLAFIAATSAARLFLEAFRGDSVIVLGGLRQAQLIALGVLMVALIGLHLRAGSGIEPTSGALDTGGGQRNPS